MKDILLTYERLDLIFLAKNLFVANRRTLNAINVYQTVGREENFQ